MLSAVIGEKGSKTMDKFANYLNTTSGIIVSLTTIITFLIGIYRLARSRNEGIKCLLRATLISLCSQIIEKGFITIDELANLDETFLAYEHLKGNGFVKDLVSKAKALEVRR